ncbi:MAG: hypothetical protein AAGG44_02170 [Planctomycetota bacterium]
MNDELFSIDDRIELLTEGELDPPAVRKLLEECGKNPEYWRTVALAFVEAQCLRRSLQLTRKDQSPDASEYLARGTSVAPDQVSPSTHHAGFEAQPLSAMPRRKRGPSRFFIATAACLLLCVGAVAGTAIERSRLGSGMHGPFALNAADEATNSTVSTQVVPSTNPDLGPSNQVVTDEPRTKSDVPTGDDTLVVGYLKWIGQFGPQSAPVFRGDQVTPEVLNAYPTIVDSRTQQRFKRLGVQVSAKRRLVSLSLNGSEYMVAMEDLSLLPVSREIL